MNVLLPAWLMTRRGRNPIDVIFHEVATPWLGWRRWRENVLAGVTRGMAWTVCRSADRVFVTIPAWGELLRPALRAGQAATWLPIPSMVATEADADAVSAVRRAHAPQDDAVLIGHFGTFGKLITDLFEPVATALLAADPRRRVLLMGRRSDAFAADWIAREPAVAGRVSGVGMIDAGAIAAHLKACDLLLQPYADGVSCRRGTTMAGLALGCVMVSNLGHLSEDFWRSSGAVALADRPDAGEIAASAERVLSDPPARSAMGERARALYARSFDVERTLEKLRGV
jgi:glycosyltransferase involved in cell wall biosynthesis